MKRISQGGAPFHEPSATSPQSMAPVRDCAIIIRRGAPKTRGGALS